VIDEARAPYNANKSEAFQISVEAMAEFYENPARAVNISLDDVGVKEQKSTHRRPLSAAQFVEHSETAPQSEAPPLNPPSQDPKHYVQNTIAHVQTPAGHYTLNGFGTVVGLRWILALLLYHGGYAVRRSSSSWTANVLCITPSSNVGVGFPPND